MKLLECIPNISEGKDRGKIDAVAAVISGAEGVELLDVCRDPDHHRTVFTFIGPPGELEKVALAALGRALKLIDMREHRGVHPRIGAVDVVPFVPLAGSDMEDAVEAAHSFGRRFAETYRIPVYFYGEAALRPERRELPSVRRGGYESLEARLKDPHWRPDAGPAEFDPRSGAAAVGARVPLIAFNVNLRSGDVEAAKRIARAVRHSSGGLSHVRAIGVLLKSRGVAQVSMNLTDYRVTPVSKAFAAVKEEALKLGVDVLESELVGLIPEAALEGVRAEDILLSNFREECIIERHL